MSEGLISQGITISFKADLSALTSGIASVKNMLSNLSLPELDTSNLTAGLTDVVSASAMTSQAIAGIGGVTEEAAVAIAGIGGVTEEAATGLEDASSATTSFSQSLMDTVSGAISGFTGSMQEISSTLGKFAGEAGGDAVSGISSFMGGIGDAASGVKDFVGNLGFGIMNLQIIGQTATSTAESLLGPAVNAETMGTAFDTLMGSTKAATDEMSKLDAFASKTPFQTMDIDHAAAQLIGFGTNVKDVIPDLTSIGDALSAVGRGSAANLDQIVNIFGKIQLSGKLTGADMNQFSNDGINAWKILEQQTGKTQGQLQKMISAGLFPAGEAIKDLTIGIEKNPLYAGGMAKQSETMAGLLSTLKSNWDQMLASFGSPILKGLEPIVNDLGNALTSPNFKSFASGVGQGIINAFGAIGNFIKQDAVPAVKDFMDVLKSPQFAAFATSMEGLGSQISSVVLPAFNNAKPAVEGLFNFIKSTALPALTDLANGLSNTIGFLKGHSAASDTLKATLIATTGVLSALFIPAIIKSGVEAVIAGAKTTAQFVAGIIKSGVEGWQAAGKLALFVGNIIKSGVEAVIAGGKVAINFVGSIISSGAEAVIAGAKVVGSFVAGLITAGAQAITTGASIVGSFVAGLITSGVEAVVSAGIFLATLVPSLLAVAGAVIAATWPFLLVAAVVAAVVIGIVLAVQHWGAISKWLTGVWSAIPPFFGWLWGQISGFFGGIGQWFHDRWTEAYNGITGALGGLGDWFQGLWDGITGIFKSGVNWVIDQINGLIKGIDNINVAGFHVSIPLIPHLASGVENFMGGMALVGEKGPELVSLPRGSNVLNAAATSGIMSAAKSTYQYPTGGYAGSGSPVVHVHVYPVVQPNDIYMDGHKLTQQIGPHIANKIRLEQQVRRH